MIKLHFEFNIPLNFNADGLIYFSKVLINKMRLFVFVNDLIIILLLCFNFRQIWFSLEICNLYQKLQILQRIPLSGFSIVYFSLHQPNSRHK